MKIVTEFPRKVRVLEQDVWIPISSGHKLAARIWLPEDAEADPVPTVLEYLPYRKRDGTRAGDEPKHHYFAGHGYASVRVDMRGAGDSFGVMHDEYTPQEQGDAVEVITWLAAQPWCTGKVGMFGISWGGFNSLQVAAHRPPALKAIITACSTDDRYTDDMHYSGGCLLNDNQDWGTTFFSILPLPGDPAIMGEGWRDNWMERLAEVPCPIETWLNHPRRDDYWKQGSINENYDDIECPVFTVGGWLDGYSSAIFRLLTNLKVPRLGLVAPHAHQWSQSERPPGPAIGFLQEALRWWDHWLKDQDTGIMDEPMLRAFMQENIPAAPSYDECPGRWIAEATWPSPRIAPLTFHLNGDGLSYTAGDAMELVNASPQTCGMSGGEWCPYGTGGTGPEFPGDQRFDDGASICFDSAPLTETMEIVGAPVVELELAVDRPSAFVAVRLNDVKPDGSVSRATYAALNLTHRDSHEFPEPMEPGKRYRVRVQLNDTAYAFGPGHRIRISVSTTYWPMVWPSPEIVTLTLFGGAGTVTLPVRPTGDNEPATPIFAEPEEAAAMPVTQFEPAQSSNTVSRDVRTGRVEVSAERGNGHFRIDDHDMVYGARNSVERMAITEDDPLSAESKANFGGRMTRGDFDIRVEAHTRLRATKDSFVLTADLDVWEGDERILAKSWNCPIPRDLV